MEVERGVVFLFFFLSGVIGKVEKRWTGKHSTLEAGGAPASTQPLALSARTAAAQGIQSDTPRSFSTIHKK